MTTFEIGVLIVLIFFCVYAITDKICKTIERVAIAQAFNSYMDGKDTEDDKSRKKKAEA